MLAHTDNHVYIIRTFESLDSCMDTSYSQWGMSDGCMVHDLECPLVQEFLKKNATEWDLQGAWGGGGGGGGELGR